MAWFIIAKTRACLLTSRIRRIKSWVTAHPEGIQLWSVARARHAARTGGHYAFHDASPPVPPLDVPIVRAAASDRRRPQRRRMAGLSRGLRPADRSGARPLTVVATDGGRMGDAIGEGTSSETASTPAERLDRIPQRAYRIESRYREGRRTREARPGAQETQQEERVSHSEQ